MTRNILLIVVFVEAAALAFWCALRWDSFDKTQYWLVVCGWVVFVVAAAMLSYNWRREERDDVRGFEVLPHEKK
jgi:hypothetical protein